MLNTDHKLYTDYTGRTCWPSTAHENTHTHITNQSHQIPTMNQIVYAKAIIDKGEGKQRKEKEGKERGKERGKEGGTNGC